MSDVFLSYAREDRALAEKLAAALSAEGYTVWWDRYVAGGEEFRDTIEEALESARSVVVLWSGWAVSSRWVRAEANRAMERGVLLPLAAKDRLKLPLPFSELHTPAVHEWFALADDLTFKNLLHDIDALTGCQSRLRSLAEIRGRAEGGDPEAQYLLGAKLQDGDETPVDHQEALKWLGKAAVRDHLKAQHRLGYAYLTGQGVDADPEEAVAWFRKAAERGYALSQYNLGLCYLRASGVNSSDREAIRWLRRASENDWKLGTATYFRVRYLNTLTSATARRLATF